MAIDEPAGAKTHAVALKPHAVVIPLPAQGHIGPLMQFSVKLAAEGFKITFVNTQRNHDLQAPSTLFVREQGLDIRFVALAQAQDTGSTAGQDNIIEVCMDWVKMGDALGEVITKLTEEGRPVTCVISDMYGAFTQDVATKFGLPRVAFWSASATTIASVMAIKQGNRPPKDTSELITWVPGAPPFKLRDLNTFLQKYDPEDFMFNLFYEPYSRLGESNWFVINTLEELEHDALAALQKENSHMFTVGPLLPDSFFNASMDPHHQTISLLQTEYDCLTWLDKQPASSVLFVSFGSIAVLSRQQFEELALGLEAGKQSLLWVIRPDLLLGESTMFPEGYLERMKERTSFVPWAPQLQVLTHKSTGGFLTHAGWNSMLESLTAGIPMLCWPYFADQMLNSRCAVERWGVGLDFEADEDGLVTRAEVEKKVRQLMEGPKAREMRATASLYKAAARKAVKEGGSSNVEWRRLVNSMVNFSM